MKTLRKFREGILANWPIKLTALVLALVLWAVFAAEETTTQLVPVALDVQPPEGRAVVGELPPVQARYGGTLRELLNIYETPPVIRKVVPSISGTSHELELSVDDLPDIDNANVVALEVLPNVITVVLDDMRQMRVQVVHRIELRPDSGFEVFGEVEISPTTITLQGPEALVSPIGTVYTEVVERGNLTGPVDMMVQIDTSGLGLVTVEPERVRITADVGAVLDQVLMGVAVVVEQDDGPWESETSAVSVTVSGPAVRVMRFTRDSVRVVARPAGTRDEEVVGLDVETPDGVTGVATPDSVLIRRPGSD